MNPLTKTIRNIQERLELSKKETLILKEEITDFAIRLLHDKDVRKKLLEDLKEEDYNI